MATVLNATLYVGLSLLASSFVAVAAESGEFRHVETDLFWAVAEALPAKQSSLYVHSAMKDIPVLTEKLEPTIVALPRQASGRLDPAAVRYALHRLFVQQRAWNIQGLDPAGLAWNSSASPADMALLKKMPVKVQALLRQRLSEGLEPHEVAVLAATIDYLLHNTAFAKLTAAYNFLDVPMGSATKEQALEAIDVYMAGYILGADIAKTPHAKMQKALGRIQHIYPSWNQTRDYIHKVAAPHAAAATGIVSIKQARDSVEEIDEKFGNFQNRECLALKDQLVKMEDQHTGRVRLSDFYGKALGGTWQFKESVPWLRKNGALDESKPNNPRVIIPNYVNSPSNCIGASRYHSLCCISECEALLGAVEAGLGKPEASPDEVRAIVEALPSATVLANRSLPELLMVRLSAIANDHWSGKVPIHGRLFAQWMHHAYPRECPYPHLAGSTKPTSIYQMRVGDVKALATDAQMKSQTTRKPLRNDAPVESAPWIQQEEYLVNAQEAPPPAWALVHGTASLAAIATIAMGLCRMLGLGFRPSSLAKERTAKSVMLSEHAFAV